MKIFKTHQKFDTLSSKTPRAKGNILWITENTSMEMIHGNHNNENVKTTTAPIFATSNKL